MKKSLLFLSLLLMLVLSACSTPLMASASPVSNTGNQVAPAVQPQAAQPSFQNQQPGVAVPPRSIAVNGSGQVTLAPEMAYINIGVHSQADNVAQALSDNNEKSQAVSQALRDNGIDEKDIQTSNFTIYPQQQYGQMGEITGTTYAVDNTVYVTVRDLTKLGSLLDVAVRSGANSINGINFDVTPATRDQAIADARRIAVDNARMQAQALADAAGVSLGDLLTISAYQSGSPNPLYAGKGGYAMDAASVPLSAGQIVIQMDVSASFLIQ